MDRDTKQTAAVGTFSAADLRQRMAEHKAAKAAEEQPLTRSRLPLPPRA
jgi:hypothetical protein